LCFKTKRVVNYYNRSKSPVHPVLKLDNGILAIDPEMRRKEHGISRQSSAMPRKSSQKMKKVDGATRQIRMQGRSGISCAQEHSGSSGVYRGSVILGACVLLSIVWISSYMSAVLLGFIVFISSLV
jgi:hypothetical protein